MICQHLANVNEQLQQDIQAASLDDKCKRDVNNLISTVAKMKDISRDEAKAIWQFMSELSPKNGGQQGELAWSLWKLMERLGARTKYPEEAKLMEGFRDKVGAYVFKEDRTKNHTRELEFYDKNLTLCQGLIDRTDILAQDALEGSSC